MIPFYDYYKFNILVKCWDLEYNRVIRHYHGHLSSVYGLDLHPTIDILVSVGRDAVARVWDMRTKANIMTLGGLYLRIPSNTASHFVLRSHQYHCCRSVPSRRTSNYDWFA